jgi:hypothetical protein
MQDGAVMEFVIVRVLALGVLASTLACIFCAVMAFLEMRKK